MIIQTANIVSGFILAAPKLKTLAAKEQIESLEQKLTTFRGTIGVIGLVLGVLALLQRMHIIYLYIPFFGASFPQAFTAIAMGLILCANFFEQYPPLREKIVILKKNAEWIGIVGIVVGAFSLF